jgi:hypothetical protein
MLVIIATDDDDERDYGDVGLEDLHLVTCTACLAKPARFHTRLPSFGRRGGTSRLTSL